MLMKRRSIDYLISQQLAIGVKKQSSPSINENVPIDFALTFKLLALSISGTQKILNIFKVSKIYIKIGFRIIAINHRQYIFNNLLGTSLHLFEIKLRANTLFLHCDNINLLTRHSKVKVEKIGRQMSSNHTNI